MAVDNFVKGKKYVIDYFDGVFGFEWVIPFSYAKVSYYDGSEATITGYNELYNNNADLRVSVYQNGTNENLLINSIREDVSIVKIEFVYDYINTSIDKEVTDGLKSYCNLVGKKSLVSIWFDENAEWVDLPCPSDYTGTSTTLVDSGRNTQGQVVGQVIASDIAKVEMKWNFLTAQQYSYIAKLFEQKYLGSFFVAVSFFDVIKNDWDGSTETSPSGKDGNNPCRVFYCGDRKVQFAKMVLNDDGTPKGYSSVSLNLIDTGKYYGE